MEPRKINICLHNIVDNGTAIGSIYDLTLSQLQTLVDTLRGLRASGSISSYELFFDDGYASFRMAAEQIDLGVDNTAVHTAIITEQIGLDSKLSRSDLQWAKEQGYTINSHGVSHAALAVFNGDALQATPAGGTYANTAYGKAKILNEQEVLYQLCESAHELQKQLEDGPRHFVLPYGLYNHETLLLAAAFTDYVRIYTCDAAFDSGQYLAPRLLITQENVHDVENVIRNLPLVITPLTASDT